MTRSSVAAVLACVLTTPGTAQEIPRPPAIKPFADSWRIALEPAGLLVDGESEWQLRGWIDLVDARDADSGFAVSAGAHGLRAERRSWAGAELRAHRSWDAGRVRPWLSTMLVGGTGDGAAWAVVADAGTRVGDFALHVRSVRLSMPDSFSRPFEPAYSGRRGYTDAELGMQRRVGSFELAALGGLRFGGALSHGQWGSVSVAVPIHPRIDIVSGGGTRPERADIGEVAGSFLSLGLRLQPRPRVVAPVPDPPRTLPIGLTAAHATGRTWTITAHTGARRSVEINGDLTGWTPVPLARSDDTWRVTVEAEPGVYHVVMRIDGGPWLPPPGLPAVPDDYGGRTGLLILR